MSTVYTRYFSALADYTAGDPIDDRDLDGEFDAMTAALNQKVLCAATAPSSPIDGQTWVNTTANPPLLNIYDTTKTKWIVNHAVPPNYISGMNLVYTDDAVVTVNAGELELQGEMLSEVIDKTLDVDAATWVNGAKGASQWAYIYAYRDAVGSWALAVSDEAPDLSDTIGSVTGRLRYQLYATVYYRYLGAVYLDASVDITKFHGVDDWIYWDTRPTVLSGGSDNAFTDVSCVTAVPATSDLVALICMTETAGAPGGIKDVSVRTNGSSDGTGFVIATIANIANTRALNSFIMDTTLQIFEYMIAAAGTTANFYVHGYKNTR